MIKKYRAYNENTDRWQYFTITASTVGWEIDYLHGVLNDACRTSEDENFDIAYKNLLRLVERQMLVKLTEIDEKKEVTQ